MSIENPFENLTGLSLRSESQAGRFAAPLPKSQSEDVRRPYCRKRLSQFVSIDQRLDDKFRFKNTYIFHTPDTPDTIQEYDPRYKQVEPDALPDGLYLYIVKRLDKSHYSLVLSKVIDPLLEIGSRHSIMPETNDDEIVSAGELRKVAGHIDFNLMSYTFGEKLQKQNPKIHQFTSLYFKKIFKEPKFFVNYNKFFAIEFDGLRDIREEIPISDDLFKQTCDKMQAFNTEEACTERLSKPATKRLTRNACSLTLTNEENSFRNELMRYPLFASYFNPLTYLGDRPYGNLFLEIVTKGKPVMYSVFGRPSEEIFTTFMQTYEHAADKGCSEQHIKDILQNFATYFRLFDKTFQRNTTSGGIL